MKTTVVKHQKRVPIRTPPHDSDPDEDKLLGPLTDVSVPRGHSNDSIALVVSPGEDDL